MVYFLYTFYALCGGDNEAQLTYFQMLILAGGPEQHFEVKVNGVLLAWYEMLILAGARATC